MNQSSYTFFFLDTETTGNKTEDRLCQLSFKKQNQPLDEIFDKLYTPPIPISFESMSIHHITTKMVEGCPQFKEAPEYTELKTIFEDKQNILIAHNAPFDVGMLQKELINPASVIDTLKLVRTLDPNMALEKHNLQFLRYKLGLNELITEKIQAHDAKSDVIVLELLFNRLFAKFSELHVGKTIDEILEIMMKISSEPMLISKITFGKHANKFIKDVFKEDRGYLEWLLKSKKDSETDETDWIYTLEYYLKGQKTSVASEPKKNEDNGMNSMFVVEKKESLVPTINLSDDEAEDDGEVVSYDENYTKELDVIEF